MLNINLYCEKDFFFLKEELISKGNSDEKKQIAIYINIGNEIHEIFSNIKRFIPKNNGCINGNIKEYYISYYFNEEIIIITDVLKKVTYAYIHNKFKGTQYRLFLTGLFRNHMNRHWIKNGYHIYHAAAIYDKESKETFIVAGVSESGKSTFVLEALNTDKYLFISEDKIVIDPKTNNICGSYIIHVKEKDLEKYKGFLEEITLINGGEIGKKFSAIISERHYLENTNLRYSILLNPNKEAKQSWIRRIKDEKYAIKLIKETQKGIYLPTEKDSYIEAIDYLLRNSIYELCRNEIDMSFGIFETMKKKM